MVNSKRVIVALIDWYLLGKDSYCPKSELGISKEICEELRKRSLMNEEEKMTTIGKKFASHMYTMLINELSSKRGLEYYTWVEARRHYLGLPMPLSSPHLFE